jgi:hypothetical protein
MLQFRLERCWCWCVHHCLCETVNKYSEEEEDGETMKTNIVTPLVACFSHFSNESHPFSTAWLSEPRETLPIYSKIICGKFPVYLQCISTLQSFFFIIIL